MPSAAERASIAYWTEVSPVDLNTQPISTGVLSSHMKETGGNEEGYSSGVGPSSGAMDSLKNSS